MPFCDLRNKGQTLPVIYQFNVKNMFNQVYYPSAVSAPNSLRSAMRGASRWQRR